MYGNHHNCIFMNINEKLVLGNQQYKNKWVLTYEQSVVLKMTRIETTVMHGYRPVYLVVNYEIFTSTLYIYDECI